LKAGLSPRTVQLTLSVLRRALGQTLKWDLAARNVALLVDGPRVEHKEIKPLLPGQVRQLLDAIKDHRLEAVFTAGLALGMRRCEVLGLRWEVIDFDARTISIKAALQRSGGKHVNGEQTSLRRPQEFSWNPNDRDARLRCDCAVFTPGAASLRASARRLQLGRLRPGVLNWKGNSDRAAATGCRVQTRPGKGAPADDNQAP